MNYSLTIPSHIAEALPDDKHFECLLTDDGILFRPIEASDQQVQLPAWAKSKNGKSEAPKAEASRASKTRRRPARAESK
jgi:hypothetical protein